MTDFADLIRQINHLAGLAADATLNDAQRAGNAAAVASLAVERPAYLTADLPLCAAECRAIKARSRARLTKEN